MKHLLSPATKSQVLNPESLHTEASQPNAIDITADMIFEIGYGTFTITDTTRIHRSVTQLQPDTEGLVRLKAGKSYSFESHTVVSIAEGEAAKLQSRSSLVRNGVFVYSGLYDSGYEGGVGGVIHVTSGDVLIELGTRVAQLLLFEAETLKMYDGVYGSGSELGTHATLGLQE